MGLFLGLLKLSIVEFRNFVEFSSVIPFHFFGLSWLHHTTLLLLFLGGRVEVFSAIRLSLNLSRLRVLPELGLLLFQENVGLLQTLDVAMLVLKSTQCGVDLP